MIVKIMAKWNPSGMTATGDAWVKTVELAFSNYWDSPQGQARRAKSRAEVTLQMHTPTTNLLSTMYSVQWISSISSSIWSQNIACSVT